VVDGPDQAAFDAIADLSGAVDDADLMPRQRMATGDDP
jgi:hypothetical protein